MGEIGAETGSRRRVQTERLQTVEGLARSDRAAGPGAALYGEAEAQEGVGWPRIRTTCDRQSGVYECMQRK